MHCDIHADRILILDFGSQYAQLIARRVREIGVFCEMYPCDINEKHIRQFNPKGIILSGGPDSVTSDHTSRIPEIVFELNVPILGICYGMQSMALQLGGAVSTSEVHELGHATIQLENSCALFAAITDNHSQNKKMHLNVWMSHGDKVTQLPPDFVVSASTAECPIAAISCEEKKYYGVQFHPEVTHTPEGMQLLQSFIIDIAQCRCLWTTENIITDSVTHIKRIVGNKNVLLALSGGVDSSVVATLMHKAIGKQLTCIFVDNGLLRLNEAEQVMAMFSQQRKIHVIKVDAQKRFLMQLEGITDPEAKRKIIGNTFISIFEEYAQQLNNITFLAQGTIYPDVIESAGIAGKAHVIKSHHNVGGLPEKMQLTLIEPLRELFKDEVREIGQQLGLPYDSVWRHPFPGPGLGVRILGEIKSTYADILRQADAIYIEELKKNDWYYKVSQAFAVFLPVKSVGVVGDSRRYSYVIALRAVETIDFMTARWAHLPYELLSKISSRIINEIPFISRVTYDVSDKPPATIEWE